MKSNLKIDNKNYIAEVSLSNVIEDDEKDIHAAYMESCMSGGPEMAMKSKASHMSPEDAKYVCGMRYMKAREMMLGGSGQLNENQKMLPVKVKINILKKFEKQGILSELGKKELKDLEGGSWHEAKAEPTAVFPQEPAPETGEINPHLMNEGLKIDKELEKEEQKTALKNPDLQSANFEVVEK